MNRVTACCCCSPLCRLQHHKRITVAHRALSFGHCAMLFQLGSVKAHRRALINDTSGELSQLTQLLTQTTTQRPWSRSLCITDISTIPCAFDCRCYCTVSRTFCTAEHRTVALNPPCLTNESAIADNHCSSVIALQFNSLSAVDGRVVDMSLSSPSFSSSLSPLPSLSSLGTGDRLLSLDSAILHYLLFFLPSHDFFLRFPHLSHSSGRRFAEPSLQQHYGQQRFGLAALQWRLLAERGWPQLHVPVWQYARFLEQKEEDVCRNDAGTTESAAPPSADNGQDERRKRQKGEVGKLWSLESHHLFQNLHLASRHLLRHAPQYTSTGVCICYRLPRVLEHVLIDQLTSRHMTDLLCDESDRQALGIEVSLLPIDYERLFHARREPSAPITFRVADAEQRPEAEDMDSLLSAGVEEAAQAQPIRSSRTLTTSRKGRSWLLSSVPTSRAPITPHGERDVSLPAFSWTLLTSLLIS